MLGHDIKCNLCGGKRITRLFFSRDFRYNPKEKFQLAKCQNCDLIYVSPRPNFAQMSRYYPAQEYWRETRKTDLKKEIVQNFKEVYQGLNHLKPKPGKILDVGCGRGDFLSLWKKDGWDVYGVELGESAIKYAKETWGIDIVNGELKDGNFASRYFDLITFSGVVEHLYDPLETLKEAHRLLKPDGILMVLVPNIGSASSRIFGPHWYHLDVPRHLYHFTAKTIKKMIERAGFVPIEKTNYSAAHSKASLTESLRLKFSNHNRSINDSEAEPTTSQKPNLFKGTAISIMNYFGIIWNRFWSIFGKGDIIIIYAKKA